MKKIAAILLVIAALCVAILVALQLAANARRQTFQSREPLTLESLDKFTATWERNPVGKTAKETGEGSNPSGTGEESSEAPPLKRTLTKEEVAEWWKREESRGGALPPPRWQRKLDFVISEQRAMFTAASASSEEAGVWYLGAATAAEDLHDWKTASAYYREVLDSSPDDSLRRIACSRLAWLEEDPAVAERLLELSFAPNEPICMFLAIRLAEATGSDALREHYLARLKALENRSARFALQMLEETNPPDAP